MNKTLLLVGVGGQGIILTSKILSEGLMQRGYDVKMSEIHGMAQRGGSVTTQIKFGEKVYSPTCGTGEADILVAFEKSEAVRYIQSLSKNGILIVSDCEIFSLPVLTGAAVYPSDLAERLTEISAECRVIDASGAAVQLGNLKAQNIVLLGAVTAALGLEDINWEDVIKQFIPERLWQLNLMAFEQGCQLYKKHK